MDLDAPPYDAAGFVPGGVFTPTCTDRAVRWYFGEQWITTSNRVDRRFDFGIQFIASIENIQDTRDGFILGNGGGYTETYVAYQDEALNDRRARADFRSAQCFAGRNRVEIGTEVAAEVLFAEQPR